MGERRRGRPAKTPDDIMTLDQAIASLKEHLLATYKNQEVAEKLCLCKATLYNKIWKKELHTHNKTKRPVLVSFEEVKRLVS